MRKIQFYLLFILIGAGFVPAKAQSLYDLNMVAQIEITFADPNWDATLDTYYANGLDERLLATVTLNGVQFDSCGIKYKGNSTYGVNNAKNPMNIKLDYVLNQDYQGWETLKLSNGKNDPSFVREVLSYEIARKYMNAPLSNYAQVYVNGNYHGLYSSTESIDGGFMQRYLYSDGNNTRFKCNPVYGAGGNGPNLQYLGSDTTLYYNSYELQSDFGWQDLVDLCDVVTNTPASIETSLDIDRAIWMLAFNNVLVNLDSYTGPIRQNYYAILGDHDRFMTLVWDLNECLGGFEMINGGGPGGGPATLTDLQQLDPMLRQGNSLWPLIKLILADSRYKRMYMAHFRTILEENFSNNWYDTEGNALQSLIGTAVNTDPNKFYSYQNFLDNMDISVGGGGPPGPGNNPTYGITELMNGRLTWLQSNAEYVKVAPVVSNITNLPASPVAYSTVTVQATVSGSNYVHLGYRSYSSSLFSKVQMYDDGAHNDGSAGDNIFGATISTLASDIEYYIYAENTDAGIFSPVRAEHEFYTLPVTMTAGNLVINEFMASNVSAIADQNGEFDDWIEIKNNSANPINLLGYYLSDNPLNLNKWPFPDTTIAGNGYMVIWADENGPQVGLHANFKLAAAGEEIYIIDSINGLIVDHYVYGQQVSDSSSGRCADGVGNFSIQAFSFGSANNCPIVGLNPDLQIPVVFDVYPNPASGQIWVRCGSEDNFGFTVLNSLGQEVYRGLVQEGNAQIELSPRASILYN